MTHLYIELNTTGIEEVNASIISKLYELASSGDLDNTSDLKGRLHSSTAKEKHVTYLNNNFDELYITADTQYLSFDDPDVETLMKRYIGTSDGVSLLDIQTFVTSGTAFGGNYTNTHTNRRGSFCENNEEKASINSFDEINLFNGITSIFESIFYGSGLTSIQLPSSITTLGSAVFINCTSLTSVTGLSGLTEISSDTFWGCSNLNTVDIDWTKITTVGGNAFTNCTSFQTDLTNSNFTLLKWSSFYNTKVYGDVNLSNATELQAGVFQKTNISSVTLPSNITRINGACFSYCTNLETINLGNITQIDYDAFRDCSKLNNIDLSKVTTMGNGTFTNCKALTNVDLSSYISGGDFSNCTALTTVIIGNANTTSLPSFYNCTSLSSFIINFGQITEIPGRFLSKCSLVTSTMDIPSTVTSIRYDAFNGCGVSTFIIRSTTPPTIGNEVFSNNNGIIYVPDVSVDTYKTTSGWSTWASRIKGISELPS